VIILKHSIFGSGTVIMPNIKIEEGVAVGALSLVKKNLKKWSIYAGVPVKLINKRKKITKKMEFSALNNI
jgi:galactoside O-acetyltransferase